LLWIHIRHVIGETHAHSIVLLCEYLLLVMLLLLLAKKGLISLHESGIHWHGPLANALLRRWEILTHALLVLLLEHLRRLLRLQM